MDPIAHSLAGATLAQTKLKELTPLATATLVIGANLPDIDALVSVLGSDASLYYRRGLTHGVLALIILPVLLTGAMMLYDRWHRRRRNPDKPPAQVGGLLALSYIGVLSHPFLDWLNTYGVRLLMPFDGRWFYGDTLFIIDAWMWLLMAAAAVFAYSQTGLRIGLWALLGVMTSGLITVAPMVPVGAKIVWWVGILLIVGFRFRGVSPGENQRAALGLVVAFCLYLALMMAGNSLAREGVEVWLGEEEGVVVTEMMTGPVPANPFRREVLAVSETDYHGVLVRLIGEPRFERTFEPQPVEEPTGIVAEALQREEIRGFVNWMRFPIYEVREVDEGREVIIRDLRYVSPDEEEGRGIGMARVIMKNGERGEER